MEHTGGLATTPLQDPVPQAQPAGQPLRVSWVAPAGLVGLSFVNFFLRIVTLGIYNFWGKTETRRRVWSAVRLDGEPLSYTGTGKELFLGFLMVMGIVILPMTFLAFAVVFAFGPESPALGIFQLLLYIVIFYLTGVAIYRATRYRLTRTNWRGIRGALAGKDGAYAWKYFWTGLLVPITMGWILPFRSTALQETITRDMRFGDRAFRFDGEAGPLYGPFAVFWIGAAIIFVATMLAMGGFAALSFPSLENPDAASDEDALKMGMMFAVIFFVVLPIAMLLYYLLSAWYRARQINHFAKHTHFESASLRSTVTGGGLIRVAIGNFLLRIAGMIFGGLLLAAVIGAVGAAIGTDMLGQLMPKAPQPGEPPPAMLQAAIFAGIIVLSASASLFGPIIEARKTRYLVENLSIDGTVPLASISQGADQGVKRGEGLAQAFDVDAF